VQMLSLSVPVYVWPPASSAPVAVAALIGTSRLESGQIHVEANAAIPVAGGKVSFGSPVSVVLAVQAVAATQVLEKPKPPSGK
jgi:hypothetical protein